ncbi:MAG: hypothetical protein QM640_06545 [Niabella sp.]
MITVNNITQLKSLQIPSDNYAKVLGYNDPEDDGGGDFFWDSNDVLSSEDGGLIFESTVLGSSGRWKRLYSGVINVRWFGIAGDGSDESDKLQQALDSLGNPLSKTCLLIPPGINITIKKTITIPCSCSFIGTAASSVITADYNGWSGADYRAIIVKSREGVNYNLQEFNQIIGGFRLSGLNNSEIISTGIFFGTDQDITLGTAVNYACYNMVIKELIVTNFDTAYKIKECWSCNFNDIMAMYCRVGIEIKGKVVNTTFNRVRLTNATKSNTSSTELRYGVYIANYLYQGSAGRPEGIIFSPGCLVYGFDNNLYILSVLVFRISDSVLDGAAADCVVLSAVANASLKGCYLYSAGTSARLIKLLAVHVSDTKIEISDNHLIGNSSGSQYGIENVGNRRGVHIHRNEFQNLHTAIFANYLNYSSIKDNYSIGLSNRMIYCQSDCSGTIIDGNFTEENCPVLVCHPTTSSQLIIGTNTSGNTKTYFRGKVTLAASSTSVLLSNSLYNSELYLRCWTVIKPTRSIGNYYIVESADALTPSALLNIETAPIEDVVIYYEVKAVPYTLV